jgi:hypothetical protein
MSMHLQRFVDRLRGFEARGAQEFTMAINDAKDLHADITRLLIELETLRTAAVKATSDEAITVTIDGGSFR